MFIAIKINRSLDDINHAYFHAWTDEGETYHPQYGNSIAYHFYGAHNHRITARVKHYLDDVEDPYTIILHSNKSFAEFCNELTQFISAEDFPFSFFRNNCAKGSFLALKLANIHLDLDKKFRPSCKHVARGFFMPTYNMITPREYFTAAQQYKLNLITDTDRQEHLQYIAALENIISSSQDKEKVIFIQDLLSEVKKQLALSPERLHTFNGLLQITHDLLTKTAMDREEKVAYLRILNKIMGEDPKLFHRATNCLSITGDVAACLGMGGLIATSTACFPATAWLASTSLGVMIGGITGRLAGCLFPCVMKSKTRATPNVGLLEKFRAATKVTLWTEVGEDTHLLHMNQSEPRT